jgi:uncharacterized membrane protein
MRPAEFVPAPSVPARETFSIGGALSRSLSIWSKNIVFFVGVSLVAYVPMLLLSPVTPTSLGAWGLWLLGIVISTVLGYIVQGLVTYSVLEQLRGRSPSAAESISRGWAKAGPLFAAALVTGILLFGASLALVIPGIILAVRWALLAPVVVAEGAADPRARSAELTAGHRWGIFGLMLIFLLGSLILGVIFGATFGVIFGRRLGFLSTLLGQTVPSALALSVTAVIYSVMYYQLRSEKEGVDIEQLTSVFR